MSQRQRPRVGQLGVPVTSFIEERRPKTMIHGPWRGGHVEQTPCKYNPRNHTTAYYPTLFAGRELRVLLLRR